MMINILTLGSSYQGTFSAQEQECCGGAAGNIYLRYVLQFSVCLGNRTKEGNRKLA